MGIVDLWWIADVAIVVGMLAAYNADLCASLLENFLYYVIREHVSKNTNISQDIKRIGDKNKNIHAYNIISLVLMFGFSYNLLVNALSDYEQGRMGIVNLAYFVYPLVTVFVSLHDVLLHDDHKNDWSLQEKQRHIIWPFNFVDSKILGKPIYGDQKVTQLITAKRKLSETTVFGQLAAVLLLAHFVPNGAFFLWCWFLPYVHERLNVHLNAIMDYFTLTEMKNKFEHFFGTYRPILKDAESHDQLGMQYEMFKRSCKPVEKVLKKQVFNKVRKAKFPVKTALCATYIARGVCLSTLFYTLGLQNPQFFGGEKYNPSKNNAITSLILGTAPIMLYYALQCIIPVMELDSPLSKKPFFRYFAWLPLECLASGYLLYKPVLNKFTNAGTTAVVSTAVCLTALEMYNKTGVIQSHLEKVSKSK